MYVCVCVGAQMELERTRSLTSSLFDVRVKTLCSVYGCVLRAMAAANCDSSVDCLTVLLLDVLSALLDTARHHSTADNRVPWCDVVEQLAEAKSEVERRQSCDLSAVTKKLAQMRESL